jgi:DNA-binding transcriptional LysR family regulator
MDLLQLRYFQVVARLENVTRAADELHIVQSSLSKTIARLEESIGVPLFDRQGRRIQLNQYGKVFLKRVERCFKELEEGQREVADLAGQESGSIRMGATTTSPQLPHIFREYLTLHPQVNFWYVQAQHPEMQERLMNGEIDLCVTFLPINKPNVCCEPLINEEVFLILPSNHRFADRKNIQLKEIADEPFIRQTAEYGFRRITDYYCRRAGFTPIIANIGSESTSPEVICSFVEAGFGNAFIMADRWERIKNDSLVKLHIENPTCQRTIWLSWVKERYLSLAACDFRKFIVDYYSKHESNSRTSLQ